MFLDATWNNKYKNKTRYNYVEVYITIRKNTIVRLLLFNKMTVLGQKEIQNSRYIELSHKPGIIVKNEDGFLLSIFPVKNKFTQYHLAIFINNSLFYWK